MHFARINFTRFLFAAFYSFFFCAEMLLHIVKLCIFFGVVETVDVVVVPVFVECM